MLNINYIGLRRISISYGNAMHSSLYIHCCDRAAGGWKMTGNRTQILSDGGFRPDHLDVRSQSIFEIKSASAILYLMLLIDSDDSFKDQICKPPLFASHASFARSSIHSLGYTYVIPSEVERSCRASSTASQAG